MDNVAIIGGIVAGVGSTLVVFALVWKVLHKNRYGGAGRTTASTKSLHDEKLKSDIILNSIEDGVILLDEQRTIQLFNPGASKISGWSVDEASGLNYQAVLKLVDDKNNEYTQENDPISKAYLSGATVRDNDAVLVTRSEKHIPLSLSVSPLLGENKQVRGAVAVFRDVSAEKLQEQQRDEFISTASHEMRTPVAAIEGYLALALNDKVSTIDARAKGYLEKAHGATQHLGELFQDLLTSAKAEDGRLASHPKVVEIGAFLEQVTEDLRFTAEKKGLTVDLVVGTQPQRQVIDASEGGTGKVIRPLYYAYLDPDRLQEVVTNLFDNAVKYTDTGKISIGLTGNDSIVQVYVRDTGPGIAPEDAKHLFQKFYRVDSTATRTIGGSGLGLYICRKIIEMYNGKIWVESELGKGSTFFINIPRLSTQQAALVHDDSAATTTATPAKPPM